MEGDLLAQLELVHIGGRAAVDHLEQLVEFVGTGLQHLQRFVGFDSVGHHLAVSADQARQEGLANTRLSSLVFDLLEGDRLGADVQRIGHAAHNGSGILGLVAGQVERLIRRAAGFTLGDAKGLPAGDSSLNGLCQRLVSLGDQLKAASLGSIGQLAGQSTRSLGHQVALGFGGLPGDQLAQSSVHRACDLDTLLHGRGADLSNLGHLSCIGLNGPRHGL